MIQSPCARHAIPRRPHLIRFQPAGRQISATRRLGPTLLVGGLLASLSGGLAPPLRAQEKRDRRLEEALPVPVPRPRPAPAATAAPAPGPSGPAGGPGTAARGTTGTTATGAPAAGPTRQPPDDPACPARLKGMDVSAAAVTIAAQPDPRCTVVEAVTLTALKRPDGTSVSFPDAPTLACVTAETFATYVRDLLAPLALGTYGSPLKSVGTGPGLECRSRDHVAGAKLSAHGQGLAVDIATLSLADGRTISVGARKNEADGRFESAARAGGCGYFHTALGPGSDVFHANHWHFDLEQRGSSGQGKFCQ